MTDILLNPTVARAIIVHQYSPTSQNPQGCVPIRQRSTDGQYVLDIPFNSIVVGFSPITGGPILAGPVAPGPWPNLPEGYY
jgi:hypothetical protein